ncbi:phosphotransferase KptA/Tpt1, partial [Usnea florida]
VDLPELQSIVATNSKKRYLLERDPQRDHPTKSSSTSSLNPADWRIRASQGHSITTVSNEKIFKPILLTDADCPDFVVHGTDNRPWEEIKRSGGLKPMGRKHIHFATKLIEEKMPPLNRDFQSLSKPKEEELDKVISGMRRTSTVMIWVDVKKSLKEGVEWWRSDNGVVLTEGV